MTPPTAPTQAARCPAQIAPDQAFFRALNDIVEPLIRSGLGNTIAGPGAFVVETTGRLSRLPRRVPLLGWRVGDTIAVTTVRPTSQWARNLEANPDGAVWLGGRRRTSVATVFRLPGGAVTYLRLQPPSQGSRQRNESS